MVGAERREDSRGSMEEEGGKGEEGTRRREEAQKLTVNETEQLGLRDRSLWLVGQRSHLLEEKQPQDASVSEQLMNDRTGCSVLAAPQARWFPVLVGEPSLLPLAGTDWVLHRHHLAESSH